MLGPFSPPQDGCTSPSARPLPVGETCEGRPIGQEEKENHDDQEEESHLPVHFSRQRQRIEDIGRAEEEDDTQGNRIRPKEDCGKEEGEDEKGRPKGPRIQEEGDQAQEISRHEEKSGGQDQVEDKIRTEVEIEVDLQKE